MRNGERDLEEYCTICKRVTKQRVRWCLNLDGTESLVQYCTLCLVDKEHATSKDGEE